MKMIQCFFSYYYNLKETSPKILGFFTICTILPPGPFNNHTGVSGIIAPLPS